MRNPIAMDAEAITGIFKYLIGVMGIIGNGLVCVVIAKVPAMRTLTNAFIFNQAVIDFLGSLFTILQTAIKTPSPLSDNRILAAIQCHIWGTRVLQWTLFTASTFNLVLLTTERYVAIVYPFKYLAYFSKKQATCMLIGVWVLATAYKSRVYIYFQNVGGECMHVSLPKASSTADGIISFLVEYLIPLVFMTFCYVHIVLQLKKALSNVVGPEPTTGQQGDNTMSGSLLRARRNTLKTLFIVFLSYTICWSPSQIAFFLHNFGLTLHFKGVFYNTSVVLVQLNTCINPIVYAFKYKQFQRGFRVLLKPWFPQLGLADETETASAISARIR